MALLSWNESYAVNVKQFDDQHKKLVDLINALHDGMKVGKGKEVMGGVLGELCEYTCSHFSAEERLMKIHAFPGYEEHKKEHNLLVIKVQEVQQLFLAGKAPLTQEIMAFLRDWLTKHIQGMDKKYTAYFGGKGIR